MKRQRGQRGRVSVEGTPCRARLLLLTARRIRVAFHRRCTTSSDRDVQHCRALATLTTGTLIDSSAGQHHLTGPRSSSRLSVADVGTNQKSLVIR